MTDSLRPTGRTTRTLNRALLAAIAGHRVLHVASTELMAKEHMRAVLTLLTEAGIPVRIDTSRRTRIILDTGGWIEFKSMHTDLEYRGILPSYKPTQVWWDHYAEELREIAQRKAEQAAIFEADMAAVRAIMQKHDLYKIVFNATAATGTHRIAK